MESANPTTAVPWSGLPPELLALISKRLRTKIDHRRFRAVCRSWRSSTPPYKFPTIKLPFPFNHNLRNLDPKHSGAYFTLTERIVYRIQLPDSKDPDFWLVKVELDDNGKARIIHPVTHRKIQISPEIAVPKVFNILDFDVTEVCSAYALRYVNPSTPDEIDDYYDYRHAEKVVYSANEDNGEYVVTAIDRQSKLWDIKSGGVKWNSLWKPESFASLFYDVAIVKGKYHVCGWYGGIWAYDSEFVKLEAGAVQFNCTFSTRKRLVELYNGELVLVDEMPNCSYNPVKKNSFQVKEPVVDMIVYGLSEQSKTWVDGKALNGCIIVVGDDCSFSVPTPQLKGLRVFYMDRYVFVNNEGFYPELGGYTGFACDCREICNCLDDMEVENLVVDDDIQHLAASDDVRRIFEGFYGHNVGVDDYESGNKGTALVFPEYANIFWPPPAWLNRSS